MYYAYTKRMANYLIENGCNVVKIVTSTKNKGFLSFAFERNDHLQELIKAWDDGESKSYKEDKE